MQEHPIQRSIPVVFLVKLSCEQVKVKMAYTCDSEGRIRRTGVKTIEFEEARRGLLAVASERNVPAVFPSVLEQERSALGAHLLHSLVQAPGLLLVILAVNGGLQSILWVKI